jgi:hypothetical protein
MAQRCVMPRARRNMARGRRQATRAQRMNGSNESAPTQTKKWCRRGLSTPQPCSARSLGGCMQRVQPLPFPSLERAWKCSWNELGLLERLLDSWNCSWNEPGTETSLHSWNGLKLLGASMQRLRTSSLGCKRVVIAMRSRRHHFHVIWTFVPIRICADA